MNVLVVEQSTIKGTDFVKLAAETNKINKQSNIFFEFGKAIKSTCLVAFYLNKITGWMASFRIISSMNGLKSTTCSYSPRDRQ